MPEQLTHNQVAFSKKIFPVTLVCDNITYQPNIGSLFRLCDAFGINKIIFIGKDLALTPRKINRTSRGTHLTVSYEVIETAEEAIAYLKNNDFEIISLEITKSSIPVKQLSIKGSKPIALVLGSEVSGVSESFLNLSDTVTHIEMFGSNSSMNVVQAAAIALYEITATLS